MQIPKHHFYVSHEDSFFLQVLPSENGPWVGLDGHPPCMVSSQDLRVQEGQYPPHETPLETAWTFWYPDGGEDGWVRLWGRTKWNPHKQVTKKTMELDLHVAMSSNWWAPNVVFFSASCFGRDHIRAFVFFMLLHEIVMIWAGWPI